MKVGIQLLLFDSGTEVVEAVGLKFAYPERIVLGFAVVDSKGFADSRSFAAIVAEGPVAEHILGRIVAGMGYRSWRVGLLCCRPPIGGLLGLKRSKLWLLLRLSRRI